MKMNKWGYMILCSLIGNHALYAPPVRSAMVKNLNVRFESIKSNLRLINKCYLTRSKKCTADERVQAGEALKNTGIAAGGLLGLLLAGKWVWGRYHQTHQDLSFGKTGNTKPSLPSPEELHATTMRKAEIKSLIERAGWKMLGITNKYGTSAVEVEVAGGFIPDSEKEDAQDIINQIHKINPDIKYIHLKPSIKGQSGSVEVFFHIPDNEIIKHVQDMTPAGSKVHIQNHGEIVLELPENAEFTPTMIQDVINRMAYFGRRELYLINTDSWFRATD